jgi:hypothetical protein
MTVIVDTSAWSLAFRRSPSLARADSRVVEELTELVREGRAVLMGPIRQELLSGISDARQFAALRERLRAFSDLALHGVDYERAAEFSNSCRRAGVQGSHVDFLICSAASGSGSAILSTDKDFARYAKHLPITIHSPRK